MAGTNLPITHWQPADYKDMAVGSLADAIAGTDVVKNVLKTLRLIAWATDYYAVTQIPQRFGEELHEALSNVESILVENLHGSVAREDVSAAMQAARGLVSCYGRPATYAARAVDDCVDHVAILIRQIEIASLRCRIAQRGEVFDDVSAVCLGSGTLQ
jgi:hypothetical protein